MLQVPSWVERDTYYRVWSWQYVVPMEFESSVGGDRDRFFITIAIGCREWQYCVRNSTCGGMEMADMSEDEEALQLIAKKKPTIPELPRSSLTRRDGDIKLIPQEREKKWPVGIAFLILCVVSFSILFSMVRNASEGEVEPYHGGELADPHFDDYRASFSITDLETAERSIDMTMNKINTFWRVDEYPIFKSLMHVPDASWDLQVNKFISTLLTQRSGDEPYKFVAAFTGSSVTAGHDNYVTEMFSAVFNDVISPVFATLNVALETRNVAIGNNPCIPYDACVAAHAGDDVDIIAWEQSMNCGRQSDPLEFFIRNSLALPKKVLAMLPTYSYFYIIDSFSHLIAEHIHRNVWNSRLGTK